MQSFNVAFVCWAFTRERSNWNWTCQTARKGRTTKSGPITIALKPPRAGSSGKKDKRQQWWFSETSIISKLKREKGGEGEKEGERGRGREREGDGTMNVEAKAEEVDFFLPRIKKTEERTFRNLLLLQQKKIFEWCDYFSSDIFPKRDLLISAPILSVANLISTCLIQD